MADVNITFRAAAYFQGQPISFVWMLSGAGTTSGSARVRILANGQTAWSATVNLPMSTARVDTIPVPATALLADRLYDIPAGAPSPHVVRLDFGAAVNGGTEVFTSFNAHVWAPRPALQIQATVVPGQPVPVTWGIDSDFANEPVASSLETATVDFDIKDSAGGYHPIQPRSTAVYLQIGGTQARVQATLASTDPAIALILYRLGRATIRATVTLTVLGFSRTYVAEGAVTVTGEASLARYWDWTSPAGADRSAGYLGVTSAWKEAYTVGGRVSNKSAFAVFTAAVQIDTTGLWRNMTQPPSGPLTAVDSRNVGPLQPGENDSVGDALITGQVQDYKWLDNVTGSYANQPINNSITYVATIVLRDSFGNTYPPIKSESFSVFVPVSQAKLSAANAAHGAFILGTTLGALAVILAVPFPEVAAALAGASALAFATLAGEIANANDPPALDRRYLSAVQDKPLPRIRADVGASVARLVAFLRSLQVISDSYEKRSKILGRVLGSGVDRHEQGMQFQHTLYLGLAGDLRARVDDLATKADGASSDMKGLLTNKVRASWKKTATAWTRSGVPDESKHYLQSNGMSAAAIALMDEGIRSDEIRRILPSLLAAPEPGARERVIAQAYTAFSEAGTSMLEENSAQRDSVLRAAKARASSRKPARAKPTGVSRRAQSRQ